MVNRSPEQQPLLPRTLSRNKRAGEDTTGTYTYGRPLPHVVVREDGNDLRAMSARVAWKTTGLLAFLGIFMMLFVLFDKELSLRKAISTPPLGLPKKVQKRWGQYSPYMPAGKYHSPPDTCVIDQVNILQRHGARYPNAEDDYNKAVKRLKSADKYLDAKLKFLDEYRYKLPMEELTPLGADQSFQAGQEAYMRYSRLVSKHNQPYIRTTAKPRVADSARNWTEGFAVASRHTYNPTIAQTLSEQVNNTLSDDCPNGSDGEKEKNEWLDVFAPRILHRLKKWAPGANLTNDDVHRLLAICPFETIAHQRPSPFCDLFTDEHFRYLQYYGDVEKYYKTGYGNPLGPIRGVGYVNELLARLTGRPVEDKTQHNASISFPLDRVLYADFTHENLMVAVYATIGLFNVTNPPDPQKMDKHRDWIARRMVPFSARMVVERLVCDEDARGTRRGQYVRVLINDAAQPLEFCGGDEHGLCKLNAFVESQGYAHRNGDGDFERCYR